MSRKTTKEEKQQPPYMEDLLKMGTATLYAKSRDELAEMVNNIPDECKYGAGAVGRNPETGIYALTIDLIKQ